MTLLDGLKDAIANQLAETKAYDLPKVCEIYELDTGEVEEAFKSKRTYVSRRLKFKGEEFVIQLAKQLVKDFNSNIIGKALNDYYEGQYYQITIPTRKKILQKLFKDRFIKDDSALEETLTQLDLNSFKIKHVFFDSWQLIDIKGLINDYEFLSILDNRFINFLEELARHTEEEKKHEFFSTINSCLKDDGLIVVIKQNNLGKVIISITPILGVQGTIKNIIFAANGPKPMIVLNDALNNEITIIKNEEFCLIYDRPLDNKGLLWMDLADWWAQKENTAVSVEVEKNLYRRLSLSLASPPEKLFFDTYMREFKSLLNEKLPALIPQVYLHYDPYNNRYLDNSFLSRQRMDFLMLLSNNKRVVIEIDGKQHYSNGDVSSPELYSKMVSADRDLKLLGYELYRFGGFELSQENAREIIKNFFYVFFAKHSIL